MKKMELKSKHVWILQLFVSLCQMKMTQTCLLSLCQEADSKLMLSCNAQPDASSDVSREPCPSDEDNRNVFYRFLIHGTGEDAGVSTLTRRDLVTTKALSLINLNLQVIAEDAFYASASILQTLDLSENSLTSLPDGLFHNFISLVDVRLSMNHFALIPTPALSNAPQLTAINLMANKIPSVEDEAFIKMTNLRSLDLSFNKLERLSPVSFQPLRNLAMLTVVGNSFACDCDLAWLRQYKNCLCVFNYDNCTINNNNLTIVEFPVTEGCLQQYDTPSSDWLMCDQNRVYNMCFSMSKTSEELQTDDDGDILEGNFLDSYLGDYAGGAKSHDYGEGFDDSFDQMGSDYSISFADITENPSGTNDMSEVETTPRGSTAIKESTADDEMTRNASKRFVNVTNIASVTQQALALTRHKQVMIVIGACLVIIFIITSAFFIANDGKRLLVRVRLSRLRGRPCRNGSQEEAMREALCRPDTNDTASSLDLNSSGV